MKGIDWRLVSSNTTLKQYFALEVRNSFDALSNPDDDINTCNNNLVTCTEVIALSTLPKKLKTNKAPLTAYELVKAARKELLKAKSQYQNRPTISALKKHNHSTKTFR